MPRERFDVEVPDGTHLGVSRDTDGAYRAHLFDDDTNELVGHAELFEPAENEPDAEPSPVFVYLDDGYRSEAQDREPSEVEKLLGQLLLLGVVVAVEKAKPHVLRWWAEQARPALRAKRDDLAARRARRAARRASSKDVADSPAQEVLDALDAYKASISSEEARARFVAALTARLASEEQLAILRNARIEGHDGPLDLGRLTADQIAESLTAMLAANPSLLAPRTAAAELGRVLGPSRAERHRHSVRARRAKRALPPSAGGTT